MDIFFVFQLITEKVDKESYSSYYDREYELKIDLPRLEFALIHDTLSKADKDRFYRVIMHGAPKVGMVRKYLVVICIICLKHSVALAHCPILGVY